MGPIRIVSEHDLDLAPDVLILAAGVMEQEAAREVRDGSCLPPRPVVTLVDAGEVLGEAVAAKGVDGYHPFRGEGGRETLQVGDRGVNGAAYSVWTSLRLPPKSTGPGSRLSAVGSRKAGPTSTTPSSRSPT
jgi:hypothetical protein